MKYKTNKILSLLLVFCMIFTFSGCLKYSSNLLDTATTRVPSQSTTNNPGTSLNPDPTVGTLPQESSSGEDPSAEPSSDSESTTDTPESTTHPDETTSAPAESTTSPEPTAPEVDPASWSKNEVIDFITQAVNKTKAYTGQVTVHRTEDVGITIESISPNIPMLKGIANSLVSNLMKPTDETITFSGGTAVNTEGETIPLLLPKRQGFSLPSSGVVSAKASKSGNDIEVNITLVSEKANLSQPPAYNAGSMGYLDISELDLDGLTIERIDMTYSGSTMKAIVNADGYVVSAIYHIPVAIDASGKAIGISAGFTCNGYQDEIWQINW